MAKGIKKKIDRVSKVILEQVASETRDNKFSRGVAYEGFNGGYIAALQDVLLALNIDRVSKVILEQVASETRDNKFSRGVAYEGFNGGYIAALQDVLLALNDVLPDRNGWWEAAEQKMHPTKNGRAKSDKVSTPAVFGG